MKKVLIVANHPTYVYTLRREIIEKLINEGIEVAISCPKGIEIDFFTNIGCLFYENSISRHGKNIFQELRLLLEYLHIINKFKPNIILTYTLKPNLYVGIINRFKKFPMIANVTGLGTILENRSFLKKVLIHALRFSLKNVDTVFFQNKENKEMFKENKILVKSKLIPGSGVNTEFFNLLKYPKDNKTRFVFISRVMKEKGIDQYLTVAKSITKKYPDTEFHICGFIDGDYKEVINDFIEKKIIIYHGMVSDIRTILKKMNCTVHPSYYPEGISNVLLESASSGRPIITTDHIGCKDVINSDHSNGFLVNKEDSASLERAIIKFLDMNNSERELMGLQGRKFVLEKFDRRIVVNEYFKTMEEIGEKDGYRKR